MKYLLEDNLFNSLRCNNFKSETSLNVSFMNWIAELCGWTSTLLFSLMSFPQVYQTFKERNANGISNNRHYNNYVWGINAVFMIAFAIGNMLQSYYNIICKAWILLPCNIFNLVAALLLLYAKQKFTTSPENTVQGNIYRTLSMQFHRDPDWVYQTLPAFGSHRKGSRSTESIPRVESFSFLLSDWNPIIVAIWKIKWMLKSMCIVFFVSKLKPTAGQMMSKSGTNTWYFSHFITSIPILW